MLNVRDFGAVGDGAADDTNAIRAAFAAIHQPNCTTVLIPSGTFRVTDTIVIPTSDPVQVRIRPAAARTGV